MKLIVGLGNPGVKYSHSRHSLGFLVLDHYAQKHLGPKISWEMDKSLKSEILKLDQVWLVKPQTFMNNSGMAVAQLVSFFKVRLDKLIVVYDEMDLPLGKIKLRLGGSAAGHHGVESIISSLGDDNFIRVRLGIGNLKSQSAEHGRQHFDVNKYVLEPFLPQERSQVKHMIKKVLLALDTLIAEGIEVAQRRFH